MSEPEGGSEDENHGERGGQRPWEVLRGSSSSRRRRVLLRGARQPAELVRESPRGRNSLLGILPETAQDDPSELRREIAVETSGILRLLVQNRFDHRRRDRALKGAGAGRHLEQHDP
jgi:hypothetical protein